MHLEGENKEQTRDNGVKEDIPSSNGRDDAETIAEEFASFEITNMADGDANSDLWKPHEEFASFEITNMADGDANSDLWKPHPPTEDCPLCFVPLPLSDMLHTLWYCCGKTSCSACCKEHKRAVQIVNAKRVKKELPELENSCPFCRTPEKQRSDSEIIAVLIERILKADVVATEDLAIKYMRGDLGLDQDIAKALELFNIAAALGSASSYTRLALFYSQGKHDIKVDKKRAKMYAKCALNLNDTNARWVLAQLEANEGNTTLATRHYRMGAEAGCKDHMDQVWKLFYKGKISKDDLENTLRKYHDACSDMNSEERARYNAWMKTEEEDNEILGEIYNQYYRGETTAKQLKLVLKMWQEKGVLLEPNKK